MFSAPPELSIEKAWIHAAEGSEVELVCTLQSDMSTDVINFPTIIPLIKFTLNIYLSLKKEFRKKSL
jgi:hypothetical protein